jgi:EpsI family protein
VSTASRWLVLLGCLLLFGAAGAQLGQKHTFPPREEFAGFPAQIGDWTGKPVAIENSTLRLLSLTDYLSRNYESGEHTINLYVGFHGSQQRGTVIHSPAHCLPANGWYIVDEGRVPLPGRDDGVTVNRMEVKFGKRHQVVYYWYQGRGRVVSDEFVSAAYRALDVALTNRSDEALVRFTTTADPASEAAMRAFIAQIVPRLDPYLPR